MTDRPHLSHSQIDMFARCAKQWEWRYAYGIKAPPGVAATIGKGTHGGAEADLRSKMGWGSLLETSEVQDAAADAFRRAWEHEPPVLHEGDPDQGEALDMAVSLAELYHRKIAPQIEPLALEQAFVIEVPQLPFDVVGVVDIQTPSHVRDIKTKKRKPNEAAARRSTQLAVYHLRSTLAGAPQKKVALDFLVKTQQRQAITIEAEPSEVDHVVFARRLELAARAIQSGVFPPTTADNWVCSERFCGYWDRCEFGSRQSVSVGLIDPARLTTRLIPRPHQDTMEAADVEAEGW